MSTKYKYFPNTTSPSYRNMQSILNSNSKKQALQSFFEIEEVQEAVNRGDWQKVFDLWVEPDLPGKTARVSRGNRYTYIYEDFYPWLLAEFLFYQGIDFMSHLSDEFIEKHAGNGFDLNDILEEG